MKQKRTKRKSYRKKAKTGGNFHKKYKLTKKNYKKLKMLPILEKKTQHSLYKQLKKISKKFNY